MSDIDELERMDVNILAMYCQRVAEVREVNSMEAAQARQLKDEWMSLISFINLSEQEIEAQTEQLRKRMLSFLSAVDLPPFLGQLLERRP